MEIEDILDELGAQVVATASTAEEAVRLAETHRPDVVTMDINLGFGSDGIDAAREIYERLKIRSIFISAYGSPEATDRAAAATPIAWISKPVDRSQLKRALDRTPRHGNE